MAVVLNKKNNVKLKIEAPMTSVSNLLIVDKGELLGDDFTSAETEKHFKGTLFKFDGENVSQIEICKVITKSGNFLTIERAVEPCPMNYSSNQMYQQAYDFEAGDWFYINLTAGDLEDIITELKATNTRIDTTNTNILNNYVSNQALQAQKGQPGGIATLDGNGYIPGSQIDLSGLNIMSLYYNNFTTGQQIQRAKIVGYTTSNVSLNPFSTYGTEITVTGNNYVLGSFYCNYEMIINKITYTYNITKPPNTADTYRKIFLTIEKNGVIYAKTNSFIYNNEGSNQSIDLSIIESKRMLIGTYDFVLNRVATDYSITIPNRPYFETTKIFGVTRPTTISLVSPSNVYKIIGISMETKSSGQQIKVLTGGICNIFSNLIVGEKYYLSSNGNITTLENNYYIGIAINSNTILLNKF